VERLVFKYITDLTVLFTQFRTGDVDYVDIQGITADHYAEAKTLKDRTIYVAPLPFVETFDFNLGRPQFQELAVRRAMYMSIDKESIVKDVYYGLQSPTESFLPTQTWAFNPNLAKQHYEPDGTKRLLDEAGWKLAEQIGRQAILPSVMNRQSASRFKADPIGDSGKVLDLGHPQCDLRIQGPNRIRAGGADRAT
jgi:ABC-type transport system substrate-binding protein